MLGIGCVRVANLSNAILYVAFVLGSAHRCAVSAGVDMRGPSADRFLELRWF